MEFKVVEAHEIVSQCLRYMVRYPVQECVFPRPGKPHPVGIPDGCLVVFLDISHMDNPDVPDDFCKRAGGAKRSHSSARFLVDINKLRDAVLHDGMRFVLDELGEAVEHALDRIEFADPETGRVDYPDDFTVFKYYVPNVESEESA